MKILITGAKGQLGRSLEKISKDFSYEFIFTDVEELDITDKDKVEECFHQVRPDVVINAAAYTAVDNAEDDREKAKLLNATAVKNLASACKNISARFIHVSTDYVFNGRSSHPYTPYDTPMPESIYGETKLLGEKFAIESCEKVNIVRTAWLYSEFGKNFVKTMIRLANERKELTVVFDQVGTPCYATDLAKAIMALVEKGSKEKILHFSNEGVCSWYDFAKKIIELSKLDCLVRPILSKDFPAKAKRPEYSVLDKSLIKRELGITIPHWEDSLKEMLPLL